MDAAHIPSDRVSDSEETLGRRQALREPKPACPERDARWAAWLAENGEAIAEYNAWFDREGHKYLRPSAF